MSITRLTFPENDLFPIEDVRAYLRKDGTNEDGVIRLALAAAIEFIEGRTSRVLAAATFRYAVDDWPQGPRIVLPLKPCREVLAVSYLDAAGVEGAIDGANYHEDISGGRGEVWFKPLYSFPSLWERYGERVFVDFRAGYDDPTQTGSGDNPELRLSDQAKILVLMFTEHWYQNRGVVSSGSFNDSLKPFEMASETLLDRLRVINR